MKSVNIPKSIHEVIGGKAIGNKIMFKTTKKVSVAGQPNTKTDTPAILEVDKLYLMVYYTIKLFRMLRKKYNSDVAKGIVDNDIKKLV